MIEQLVRARPVNRLLKMQLLCLFVIAISVFGWQGREAAIAASFGGMIGVANTVLLKWHLFITASKAGADPAKNVSGIYRCIAERWVLTIAMFVVGFAVFEFSALPVLLGFAAMQMVILFMRQA